MRDMAPYDHVITASSLPRYRLDLLSLPVLAIMAELRSRVPRLLKHPFDGFIHCCFHHDPGRSTFAGQVIFDYIMRRKIIKRNDGNVAHASGTAAEIPVTILPELFYNGMYALIICVDDT